MSMVDGRWSIAEPGHCRLPEAIVPHGESGDLVIG
jgi:hypothetical protein